MAHGRVPSQNRGMPGMGSYSFLFGPLLALAAIGLLLWVARGASGLSSLVERPARRGAPEEYGLMIPVASPDTPAGAEALLHRLAAEGIPGRTVATESGLRVMVWAEDVSRARSALEGPGRPGA